MKILSLFLCLFFLSAFIPADAESPYLAVFANPGTKECIEWGKFKPDLFVTSGDWEDLDNFLKLAKRNAGNRPLVIDIECHGSPVSGCLYLQYSSFGESISDGCSMGYLVKHIDSYFHNKKNLTVCLEACYSAVVASRTLVNKMYLESDEFHVDSFNAIPTFPIYGIGQTANYNNLIYMQFKYGVHYSFHDLREYMLIKEEVKPDFDPDHELGLRSLVALLTTYGL